MRWWVSLHLSGLCFRNASLKSTSGGTSSAVRSERNGLSPSFPHDVCQALQLGQLCRWHFDSGMPAKLWHWHCRSVDPQPGFGDCDSRQQNSFDFRDKGR